MQKTLTPRKKIDSEGKIAYSESFQAWNTFRLKKEMFLEFPQLKEKISKFSYELIYCRDPEEFEKYAKELVKEGKKVMPLLLWLYKD